jgi:hypothetical protein
MDVSEGGATLATMLANTQSSSLKEDGFGAQEMV